MRTDQIEAEIKGSNQMDREIEAIIAREVGYGRVSNGSDRSGHELVEEEEFRSDAYRAADAREEMFAGLGRINCVKVFHDLHSSCPFDCHFRELDKSTQQ